MIEPNTSINFLKYDATLWEQKLSRKLPHDAAQKLQEILLDDKIQADEFIAKFNEISATTETLRWKTFIYLANIKARFFDIMESMSLFQVSAVMLFFILFLFLSKKVKVKKRLKRRILGLTINLLERFFAALGYTIPVLMCYSAYYPNLLSHYPVLGIFFPPIIRYCLYIFTLYNTKITWGSFILIVILIRKRIPRSRFIRFHLFRGLVLTNCGRLPDTFLSLAIGNQLTAGVKVQGVLLLLNLYWILPAIAEALLHTYPRNSFIRDNIEIFLGREKDDGFKWWNR